MVLSPISWRAAAKSIDAKYEISDIVFFGAVPTLSRERKECLQSGKYFVCGGKEERGRKRGEIFGKGNYLVLTIWGPLKGPKFQIPTRCHY